MLLKNRQKAGGRGPILTSLTSASLTIPKPSHLLEPGERAVWWDKPDPMSYAKYTHPMTMIMGLFAFGFSLFWMYQASSIAGGYFWMFGLLIFGVAVWQVSEPVRRYMRAKSIIYLVTDRRAVVASGDAQTSVSLLHLGSVERQSGAAFENLLFMDPPKSMWNQQQMPQRDGFVGIRDAAKVEADMRRLAEELRRAN